MKRIASVAAARLDWRDPEHHLGRPGERGAIARTLAYLFGFGALLLLATLALPGSPERDSVALAVIALVAFASAIGLIVAFDRIPWWMLVVGTGVRDGARRAGDLVRRTGGVGGLRDVPGLGRDRGRRLSVALGHGGAWGDRGRRATGWRCGSSVRRRCRRGSSWRWWRGRPPLRPS